VADSRFLAPLCTFFYFAASNAANETMALMRLILMMMMTRCTVAYPGFHFWGRV